MTFSQSPPKNTTTATTSPACPSPSIYPTIPHSSECLSPPTVCVQLENSRDYETFADVTPTRKGNAPSFETRGKNQRDLLEEELLKRQQEKDEEERRQKQLQKQHPGDEIGASTTSFIDENTEVSYKIARLNKENRMLDRFLHHLEILEANTVLGGIQQRGGG